jgi:hypothetical protein
LPRNFLATKLPQYRKQAGASVKNGKLLRMISVSGKFDLFLTFDKNLPSQNRSAPHLFAIVVLRAKSNRLEHILPFGAEILRRMSEFVPGRVYTITSPV